MKSGFLRVLADILVAGLMTVCVSACDPGGAPTGGGTGAEGLTGKIVDSRGIPVRGARVWLFPDTASGLAKRVSTGGAMGDYGGDSLVTGKAGRFTFKRVPPGRYALSILYTRDDSTFAIYQSGIAVEGDLDWGTDTLRLAGSLNVYAGDAHANALPGAHCEILGSPWYAVSNASGNCVFRNIGAGDMLVKVTSQGRISVPATALVRSGDTTAACQVFLYQPDQDGWVFTTEQNINFWIPATLVVSERNAADASLYALYKQPGLELAIRNSTLIDLGDPSHYPEYRQDTVTADTGESVIVQSWRYPSPTDSVAYGAQLNVSQWVLLLKARTEEDRETALRILRTVRK